MIPFTDEEIAAVRRAIAMGARVTEIGGERVERYSKDDLLKALAFMTSQNQAAGAVATPSRYSLASFERT